MKIEEFLQNKYETPFYFYDLEKIKENYSSLNSLLGKRGKIIYSMKANPNLDVLKKIKTLGAYVDVSSIGEIDRAFAAGFSPSEMSFVGPGKTQDELYYAISHNVAMIDVESLEEIENVLAIAGDLKKNINLGLRIAPPQYYSPNGRIQNDGYAHFGISLDQIQGVKDLLKGQDLVSVSGVHFFVGSQYLEMNYLLKNFELFIEIYKTLKNDFPIKYLNLGGGFGIDYFNDSKKLESDSSCFTKFDKLLKDEKVQIFFESGRYLVGNSGYFVTEVLYTKSNYGKKIAVCNGGFSHFMAATGIGQLMRRIYPISVIQKKTNENYEKITLVGPSCYSVDNFCHDLELPVLEKNDYVVIANAGAYGKSFSPENFLLSKHAKEYCG